MGCHSCLRLEGLTEAHGRRHSGRAAVVIEGLARDVVSLLEVVRHMVMRRRVKAVAGRGVGRAEEGIAAVAAAEAAAAVVVEVSAVAGIAQAKEMGWAPAATLRRTSCRGPR